MTYVKIELFEIELLDHLTELLVIHSDTWNDLILLTYAKLDC